MPAPTTAGPTWLWCGPRRRRRGWPAPSCSPSPASPHCPPTIRWPTRTELELADLADDPLVVNVVSGVTSPQLWPDHGRDRHTVRTRNSEEWVYAIALGRGIGVTVTSTAELFGHPGVRFVPVVDAPAVPVLAVWPRRGAHPLVPDLIEAGRRVAARPERAEPEPGGGAV